MYFSTSHFFRGLLSSFFFVLSFSVVLTEVQMLNYIVKGQLPDGEREVRMKFGEVVVKETSISPDSGDLQSQQSSHEGLTMMLRQVASGPDLLQLIYKINRRAEEVKTHLVECEVINDWEAANQFRNTFQRQLQRLGLNHLPVPLNRLSISDDAATADLDLDFDPELEQPVHKDVIDLNPRDPDLRNVTVQILSSAEISEENKAAFDVVHQEKQCKRLHRRLKKRFEEKQIQSQSSNSRVRRDAFSFGIIPGTYWCGLDKVASQRSSIGAHTGTDMCCRQHDHCPINISPMTTSYGIFNFRMNTISHCSCDERPKRALALRDLGEAFRVPGTKWCGRGFTAKESKDLGGYTGADKCCRSHDLGCPFYIESMSDKFGLFNWRIYTIMHCRCDERFRSCLKQTNTGAADFVGKLFFNVVQTKCFVLKPESACVKRSWWGKCLKTESKKQAHLRDPLPY